MAKCILQKLMYRIVVNHFVHYCDSQEKLAAVYKALIDYNLFLHAIFSLKMDRVTIYEFIQQPTTGKSMWTEWTTSQYKDLHDLIGID